ncbi:MAG: Ger(x)C family spore germination C-terminal domain-containing protein [Christensenellales bacterium]
MLGLRLSKYLEVLFEHYEQLDVIPPSPNLSAVIAAMESAATDAAAVYAAGNDFDNILLLQGKTDIDRLPGHLPRTAPAPNEYMGAALFSGPRMTGTLTGNEVSLFCLMTGKASTRVSVIDGAQYKTRLQTRVKRRIDPDGTLFVSLRLTLTLSAGNQRRTEEEIAAEIAQDCVNVLQKLQAASCDAVGFGKICIRAFPDIPAWERLNWPAQYETLPVRVTADVKILQ